MVNLQREVNKMWAEMVKSDHIVIWSRDVEVTITPVLIILYESMKHMKIGGGVTKNIENENPSPEIISLENHFDEELRELSARLEGRSVFIGERWFRYQSTCEDFARDKIPEGQFQWFIDMVSYLQFLIG